MGQRNGQQSEIWEIRIWWRWFLSYDMGVGMGTNRGENKILEFKNKEDRVLEVFYF